ncbi:hypothetical protein [Nostoc sp. PA-18-2419]|nr:hypothetical protein [Nostoc sp. PA-18-2419]
MSIQQTGLILRYFRHTTDLFSTGSDRTSVILESRKRSHYPLQLQTV